MSYILLHSKLRFASHSLLEGDGNVYDWIRITAYHQFQADFEANRVAPECESLRKTQLHLALVVATVEDLLSSTEESRHGVAGLRHPNG